MGLVCVWLIEMILLPSRILTMRTLGQGVVVLCDKHTAIPPRAEITESERVTLKRHTDVYQIA